MKNILLVLVMLVCGPARGQAVLTFQSYANTINLAVPAAVPGAVCAPVRADAASTPLAVKRTFLEGFDSFDLKSRTMTPHYDAGYVPGTGQWNGYGAIATRYQAGMQEQQLYVDPGFMGKDASPLYLNPFNVAGGYMTIHADVTPAKNLAALSNFPFTSGVLTTRKSFSATYGYFEARIKVPYKPHGLPAFWMVPVARVWPPELDIMEAPSHKVGEIIQTTAHWPSATGGDLNSACELSRPGYSNDFHQYGALWTAERIVWYIDRVPVAQMLTPASMNQPMFMQLNLAIGGTWVGKVDLTSPAAVAASVPSDMVIDNVVAYSVAGPAGCLAQASGEILCK